MKQFQSMSVGMLVKALNHMLKNGEVQMGTKVLMSRDSEGNGYNTLNIKTSFGRDGISDTLFLYPHEEIYADDLYSEEDYEKMPDHVDPTTLSDEELEQKLRDAGKL